VIEKKSLPATNGRFRITISGVDAFFASGREWAALRHGVRLMSAVYVTPYVKRGKNDTADAEARWSRGRQYGVSRLRAPCSEQV